MALQTSAVGKPRHPFEAPLGVDNEAIFGAIGCMAPKGAAYPLEETLALYRRSTPERRKQLFGKGLYQYFVWRQEPYGPGIETIWSGFKRTLTRHTMPNSALIFGVYEVFKFDFCYVNYIDEPLWKWSASCYVSGALAGATARWIAHPFLLYGLNMVRQPNSMLFQGVVPAAVTAALYRSIMFGTYDSVHGMVGKELNCILNLIIGTFAAGLAGVASQPLKQLILLRQRTEDPSLHRMSDLAKTLYKLKGWKGFFVGAEYLVLNAATVGATLAMVDVLRYMSRAWRWYGNNNYTYQDYMALQRRGKEALWSAREEEAAQRSIAMATMKTSSNSTIPGIERKPPPSSGTTPTFFSR
jgi:hypothetical protein